MQAMRLIAGIQFFAMTLTAADFEAVWKLDLARSRPSLDLAGETMTIERTGPSSRRTVIDVVLRSGEKSHQVIHRVFDGKEHPAAGLGFSAAGVTEICEQVDALTRRIVQKRDGKVTSELTLTLSADGKAMTIVRKGQGAETLVLVRQSS